MLFKTIQEELIAYLRMRVRTGELTERGLARITGVSQPHIHNVLKGIRSISLEYADQILTKLDISLTDLVSTASLKASGVAGTVTMVPVRFLRGEVGPSLQLQDEDQADQFFPVPQSLITNLISPAIVKLARDPLLEPYFQSGDMVLVDRRKTTRADLVKTAFYLVQQGQSTVLRGIRVREARLNLIPPGTLDRPKQRQSILVSSQDLSKIVRGRVIWLAREFPGLSQT